LDIVGHTSADDAIVRQDKRIYMVILQCVGLLELNYYYIYKYS